MGGHSYKLSHGNQQDNRYLLLYPCVCGVCVCVHACVRLLAVCYCLCLCVCACEGINGISDVVVGLNNDITDSIPYLHSSLREAKPLLHNGRQLSDSPSLFPEHVLRPRGENDDLRSSGGDPHLDATVAVLRELLLQEAVKLGLEQPVTDELRERGCGASLHIL